MGRLETRLWTSPLALEAPHPQRMGVYARLYDYLRQRRSHYGGMVERGRPITDAEIASDLGWSPRWVRRGRQRLKQHGYIETREIRNKTILLGLAYKIAWPCRQMRLLGGNVVEMGQQKPCKTPKRVRPRIVEQPAKSVRVILKNLETTPRKAFRSDEAGAFEYLSNREQKAERLRRELADLRETYAGANSLPEDIRLRIADILIELEETESQLTEAKVYLAAEARREVAEARREAV